LVYATYPITPASDILHYLAELKKYGVITLQAEDEIAAIGMAIGASFAGSLGVTATSGPGICLKSEAIGLAVMTELPCVIIDVQRGGPSTGLPTKTEQAALLQAMFARNGDCPPAFLPYKRGDRLVRQWAITGTRGLEHRIGGLEKEDVTGNVSYDPVNHEHMVQTRAKKIANIANEIPELEVVGPASGDL